MFLIVVTLDGNHITAAEALVALQIAGIEKFDDAPQLSQAIFHWCAGQRDPIVGPQLAHRLGLFGIGILDVLGFIQDQIGPDLLHQQIDVAPCRAIAGQNQIVIC